MPITVEQLVAHYRDIAATRMQGLPIVNSHLDVEAVSFRTYSDDEVGILITPWFMNLVVLPGSGTRLEVAQGDEIAWTLPAGDYAMTCCRDETLGDYLTAVLFRTVADFPDQATARDIAETIVEMIFTPQDTAASRAPRFSRRELFSRLGAD